MIEQKVNVLYIDDEDNNLIHLKLVSEKNLT